VSGRRARTTATLTGLALVLAVSVAVTATSCASSAPTAAGTSRSPSPPVSLSPSVSPSPTPSSLTGEELRFSDLTVSELRQRLRKTFARDPQALFGVPMRATSPAAIDALRKYFATVDASTFNGASKAAFVWAFTMVGEPGGLHSTSTRLYPVVYFKAWGDQMIAAGSIAPGYNQHLFLLTRPSRHDVWRVSGPYNP
jgi:hypothetical protein